MSKALAAWRAHSIRSKALASVIHRSARNPMTCLPYPVTVSTRRYFLSIFFVGFVQRSYARMYTIFYRMPLVVGERIRQTLLVYTINSSRCVFFFLGHTVARDCEDLPDPFVRRRIFHCLVHHHFRLRIGSLFHLHVPNQATTPQLAGEVSNMTSRLSRPAAWHRH